MQMLKRFQRKEYFCLAAVLLVFLLMSLYKLTDAPLWYDEVVEFYYSKYLSGPIQGVSIYNSLYERLQFNSFQPPLYNLIMHVWLLFSESEWWFRFSGVVFGFIGMLGLYACMKMITNWKVAVLSVFVSSFIYELMYYVKEAAEYNLMLMLLYWMLYFYFRTFRDLTLKNIGLFTGISVILLYTQYGTVLAILPLAIALFIKAFRQKDKKLCRKIAIIYVASGAIAGLPLFFLLFRIQLQWNQSVNYYTVAFEKNNVIYDFFMMILTTAQWLFTESKTRFTLICAAALLVCIIFAVLCIVKRKNQEFNYFMISCVAGWIIYYIIVRSGLYAYGDFGNRYSLYLLPVWFVAVVYLIYESVRFISALHFKHKKLVLNMGICFILVIAMGYCTYGFYRVQLHWAKSDTRSVVDLWYEEKGFDTPTYVIFGEAPSFTYYLTHDSRFDQKYMDDITFEYENKETKLGADEYWDYFVEKYQGQPPEEFYLSIGHENSLTDALRQKGYTLETEFISNTILFHVYK